MKKEYAEKKHEHWIYVGMAFVLLFLISGYMIHFENRMQDLEDEMASMPHYECWNESFEGFVNRSDYNEFSCWGEFLYEGQESSDKWWCNLDGYQAYCEGDRCYIDDTKEVCRLDKSYAFRDDGV